MVKTIQPRHVDMTILCVPDFVPIMRETVERWFTYAHICKSRVPI